MVGRRSTEGTVIRPAKGSALGQRHGECLIRGGYGQSAICHGNPHNKTKDRSSCATNCRTREIPNCTPVGIHGRSTDLSLYFRRAGDATGKGLTFLSNRDKEIAMGIWSRRMSRIVMVGSLTVLVGSVGLGIAYGDTAPKVAICHLPPGNPTNVQLITVGAPAVPAHLAHGDLLADCAGTCGGTAQVDCAGVCNGSGTQCGDQCCSDGETCEDNECVNVCQNFTGTGCYWQENTSGNFCWVPSPSGFPSTVADCQSLDSCSSNGGGLSGGGCYRWADCSLCDTIYPNPTWP